MAATIGLATNAGKNGSRKTRKETFESCQALLENALNYFSQGKGVRFKQVRHLYDDVDAFYRDCKRIATTLGDVAVWLEELGVPVPHAEFDGGELRIAVRGFASRISRELRNERKKLATALLSYELSNKDPLLPPFGTIYLGFGTTVLAVAEYLCKKLHDLENLSMCTSNIEVLVQHFVLAPASIRKPHFHLPGGGDVNWHGGCVIPAPEPTVISTSVISYEAMNRSGQFFADTQEKCELVNRALARSKRIILVAEAAKFKDVSAQYEIKLPGENRETFLFTNGQKPKGFKLPRRVKFINCNEPHGSGSIGRRAAKPK